MEIYNNNTDSVTEGQFEFLKKQTVRETKYEAVNLMVRSINFTPTSLRSVTNQRI